MKSYKYFILILALFVSMNSAISGQEEEKKDVHEFTMLHQVETTSIKDQNKTGTCWSFATMSFLETELIRMGKGEFDLSEMFNVRYTYPERAESYIRYHGKFNFGNGAQAHDVTYIVKNFGLVPEKVFPGKTIDPTGHNHGEMDAVLKAALDAVLQKRGGEVTPLWKEVIEETVNTYLGEVPEKFKYEGKEYTPESFRDELGINPDDYVEFTSYTHHPFYTAVDLEIPDNFRHSLYYNVPIDDMLTIIDNAIENGYSVAWDGDVGRKHFLRDECYAVIPAEEKEEDEEITEPEVEKEIIQADRQKAFDSFDTTDDHLMHITGIAEDQNRTKFYYTKNSWGTDYKYGGFWYMSEQYVKLRTVAIMVHKEAVPDKIRNKLGF
ncbi:aminopeptidase C [Bacteroidota bacterium]